MTNLNAVCRVCGCVGLHYCRGDSGNHPGWTARADRVLDGTNPEDFPTGPREDLRDRISDILMREKGLVVFERIGPRPRTIANVRSAGVAVRWALFIGGTVLALLGCVGLALVWGD